MQQQGKTRHNGFGVPVPVHLLIVDDHEQVRAALVRRLRRVPGAMVLADVGDVGSAVQLVAQLKPDLVLFEPRNALDHDAAQLCPLVAAGRPVIVWTSSLAEDEAAEYVRAGAIAVLLKDPNISALVAKLASIAA